MKLSILALTAIASMIVSGATVPSNQSSKLGNLPEQSIMAAGETHSTDVIAVYSMNEGWYANGNASVAICLSGVTGNGFGVFAGCDIKNERVHIYDKYGQEKDLLYNEECNANSVIINRTKGLSYNGSIIRVPKGFQFAPTNPWLGTSDYVGDVFTLENEAVFVCNLEDGQAGAWDVLQSPKGIVVNQESYSLGLGESAFIAAAPIGVTNVKENYKSSDENVCTVAADGTIAAVGQGSCVVSINYGLTRKEVSVTVSSESHEQTGIKIVKGKEITAYTDDDEAYSLSDLKVVKVYNDKPEGEEITIDKSMISGEFNPKVPGEYTLTVTDGKFSDTFKVIIKETAVTGISELQQNYNFGNNSGWGNFYFQTDFNGQMPTQYLNIHDAAFDDLNNHILFNGETGKLRSAKCFNGSRYELWLAEDVLSNLKIGDTITITKDTPIYYYSTTTDGNHEPDGLGKYQKVAKMDNEYKFVYDGTLWNVYQGEPTEFTLNTIEITLNVGFDTLIDYTLGPSGTYGLPIFTSKDPAIASVDAYGRVTGIAEGETTISVSFKDEVKEVKVKVEPAKEIASVYLTDCPEKYYVLKGSSNTFNPILTKGRFIFTDGSYGAVVDFAREGSTLEVVDTLDVNTTGTQTLNAKVKNYRGNDYNTTITVEVYEYTDQTVDVTAIVDWFNYYVFLQFPSTSNNTKANFTGTQKETEVVSGKTVVELLKDQGSYISYIRQDGTKVNLNTPYQLQSNVLVIPEFCDEKLDENGKVIHEKANAENYNTKGYYEEGDVITVKKGMPLYRWTGSVGATDADFIENSGQIIIDGYTSEDQVFVFKNNNWALFKEYTDIQLNTPTMSIEVGKTQLIDVKRVPNDATQGTFSFVSSDESVATVSSTGVVKGIGEGTATITITLEDPDHPEKKKTATCTVTVTKSSKEDPKPNEKKGCGGEIITTSAVLASLGLIGAAIGFSYLGKKKKEEDK